jgi:uncharacterized protein YndB with AHSA1/START domain
MPVNHDPDGRRWVQAEVDVPGTPEEVWNAIATGPGISSWFVPTQVEEREGGAITANFGPGMESHSQVTAWEPPRRFVANSRDDMGPEDPSVATEWTVEAQAGGTCKVRVVHSWFASTDNWDAQFEGHSFGWIAFFEILRNYLTHFRGQPSTLVQLMGVSSAPTLEAWGKLTTMLGLNGATEGERITSAPGAPQLAGIVEKKGYPEYPMLIIRLDSPAPGVAHLFALLMGDTYLPIRFYLYGDQAPAAAAQAEPEWQAWLAQHFAPALDPTPAG